MYYKLFKFQYQMLRANYYYDEYWVEIENIR